eukprot:CAMPEP_0203848886 /NCGR_PEP_ID=MMETSP0359-20131031/5854_1 /ASSEMBLY_ACC=CAM_ASM_000338 /TAXON_ID=268821 /ORGANISM="Scrippsiella Hangoei, Strain SHTV-5" /LENGTH=461 /DNA_ID=CAMNT_0050764543 /DNA_START=71 /DNA_END=1456 /DNA_ORIENTATION=-
MSALNISLSNALTGAELSSITACSTDTVFHLHAAVAQALGGNKGFKLLLADVVLEPSSDSLEVAGLKQDVALQVVACANRARFRRIGTACPGSHGYHIHDTSIRRMHANELGKFFMAWHRGFFGDSYDSRNRGSSRPYVHEVAIVDVAQTTPEPVEGPWIRDHIDVPSSSPLVTVPGHMGWLGVLGLFDYCPVLAETASGIAEFGETASIVLRGSDGSSETLWRQDEDAQLLEAFGGMLCCTQGFFSKERFFVLACLQADMSYVLLEGVLQRHDDSSHSLNFNKWARQDDGVITCESFAGVEFLGTDLAETAVFMHVGNGAVAIFPLNTLKGRLCLSEEDSGRCSSVGYDPLTAGIYLFLDLFSQCEPPCKVYRIRAPECVAAVDLNYDRSSMQLICKPNFEVERYGEHACVLGVAYDFLTDCLIALDGEHGFWSLPLKDARSQEATEEGDDTHLEDLPED